jgi:hypothetical protein
VSQCSTLKIDAKELSGLCWSLNIFKNMEGMINRIKQTTLSVAEQLTPVLKESKFRQEGRITPEEFVSQIFHHHLLSLL